MFKQQVVIDLDSLRRVYTYTYIQKNLTAVVKSNKAKQVEKPTVITLQENFASHLLAMNLFLNNMNGFRLFHIRSPKQECALGDRKGSLMRLLQIP